MNARIRIDVQRDAVPMRLEDTIASTKTASVILFLSFLSSYISQTA